MLLSSRYTPIITDFSAERERELVENKVITAWLAKLADHQGTINLFNAALQD
jgi:hypothetical protein